MTGLTKVSVNLTQNSMDALYRAAEFEEISRTDVMNRAVQLYAHLVTMKPGSMLSVETPVGDLLRLIVPTEGRRR